MASNSDIITENDMNVKAINEKARGKLSLQRDIFHFIAKHEAKEENRRKSQAAGAPVLTRAEELIKKRSEAQKKKGKRTDQEEIRPLDADGVHQPVTTFQWDDAPGPIKKGEAMAQRVLQSR